MTTVLYDRDSVDGMQFLGGTLQTALRLLAGGRARAAGRDRVTIRDVQAVAREALDAVARRYAADATDDAAPPDEEPHPC